MSLRLTPGGIYLFVGRTGSGKSHLMKHVAGLMERDFDAAFGFCPTTFAGNIDFIRPDRRFLEFDAGKVGMILKCQQEQVEKTGSAGNVLLLFDDVLGEASLKLYGGLFTKLASTCRHYRITIFITTQYIYKVPPVLRENAKLVFICSASRPDEISTMYKEFGIGLTKDAFSQRIVNDTNGFGVLAINMEAKDTRSAYVRVTAPAKAREFQI